MNTVCDTTLPVGEFSSGAMVKVASQFAAG